MPVQTKPWQPVIYDAMLMAASVLSLRHLGRVDRWGTEYCEHEKNLITALSRIRNLAQFLSPKGGNKYINVTDPEFGGVADRQFAKKYSDKISKYVSHPDEQRYKKQSKYPRPTAKDACDAAKKLIPVLKTLLDPIKGRFSGDAARRYSEFEATAFEFEGTYR